MEKRVLAGRYELLTRLGGSSWHARDTELVRDVLVRLGRAADDPGVALSHPSVARVFDSGETDGEPYVVLEYLAGGSLAERGELPEEAAADVAAALAHAHALGISHGALSAETILFDADGRAKVVGFRGEGDPANDRAALDALVTEYGGTAVAPPPPPPEEPTTLIQPPPARPGRRRRGGLVLAAVALAALGVAAALLAVSDDSPADAPTGSLSIEAPPSTFAPTTEEPEAPPPATTESTEKTTTARPETEPPPTTTEPLPTISVPLPTVTETLPTEPPPPTEPLPPTTTEQPLP